MTESRYIFASVFHRILDFKAGLDFHLGPFFILYDYYIQFEFLNNLRESKRIQTLEWTASRPASINELRLLINFLSLNR